MCPDYVVRGLTLTLTLTLTPTPTLTLTPTRTLPLTRYVPAMKNALIMIIAGVLLQSLVAQVLGMLRRPAVDARQPVRTQLLHMHMHMHMLHAR